MRGSSRSSTWLAIAGTLLALGSFGSSAQAQECTSDDECESGSTCRIYASSGTDCAPDAGACQSETIEYGECTPKPIACKQDSDCPTDLTCVTEHSGGGDSTDCSSARDGGSDCVADEEPEPSAPQCEYLWTQCKKDSDCRAGHFCLIVDVKQCGDPGSACPPGQDCPTPPKGEPTCTTVRQDRGCFPKRVDCTSDSQCEKGWQCFDLSAEMKSEPPPGWEDAEQVCLPDGFVLAVQEKVPVGNDLRDDASDDKGGSGGLSTSAGDSEDGDDAADTSKAASDDGCSVSDVARDTRSGAAVLLVALSAVLVGRRRVRSRVRRDLDPRA